MRASDKGLAFIAGHEGVVTRAYRDVAGVWTIGVGHTAAAGPPTPRAGMTITRDEAFAILARDLPRYERRVDAALGGVEPAELRRRGVLRFQHRRGASRILGQGVSRRQPDRGAARPDEMGQGRRPDRARTGDAARSRGATDLRRRLWQCNGRRGCRRRGQGLPDPARRARFPARCDRRHCRPGDQGGGARLPAGARRSGRRRRRRTGDSCQPRARRRGAQTHRRRSAPPLSPRSRLAARPALAAGGDPLLSASRRGLVVLVLAGGFFAWRYRGELRRLLRTIRGV